VWYREEVVRGLERKSKKKNEKEERGEEKISRKKYPWPGEEGLVK
jgi:hypothetical protein